VFIYLDLDFLTGRWSIMNASGFFVEADSRKFLDGRDASDPSRELYDFELFLPRRRIE
jgi:hypothetical protein